MSFDLVVRINVLDLAQGATSPIEEIGGSRPASGVASLAKMEELLYRVTIV